MIRKKRKTESCDFSTYPQVINIVIHKRIPLREQRSGIFLYKQVSEFCTVHGHQLSDNILNAGRVEDRQLTVTVGVERRQYR